MSRQPVPETLKRINMRRFLDALREGKACSRADLTRVTQVSAATSSKIIVELLEAGLIEELDEVRATQGRPGRLFCLARTGGYVLGVQISSAGFRIGRSGLDGELLGEPEDFGETISGPGFVARLGEVLRGILSKSRVTCMGIGLSVPGLVREATGVIEYSPLLGVLSPVALADEIATAIGLPVSVVQENHGLAMAEQYFGAATQAPHFLLVDVGDGVGMSVVDQGRLLLGRDGFTAELGHFVIEPAGEVCSCGNRGCVQTVANHAALMRNSAKGVGALARAIAGAVNLYNPAHVFVSGEFFADESRLDELKAAVLELALAPIRRELEVSHTTISKVHGAVASIQERIFAEVGPRLV